MSKSTAANHNPTTAEENQTLGYKITLKLMQLLEAANRKCNHQRRRRAEEEEGGSSYSEQVALGLCKCCRNV